MTKLLQIAIPKRGHERIRDMIGCILINEFKNQSENFKVDACEGVQFFADRIVSIDKSETAIINICLWKGDYSNQDVNYKDGIYQYVIEIATNSKTKGDKRGDSLAAHKLHKLLGIVDYILSDAINDTLQFERPFILNTHVSKFQILRPDDHVNDSSNTAQAQAIFSVRTGEMNDDIIGAVVAGTDTNVTLELTEMGYEFSITY